VYNLGKECREESFKKGVSINYNDLSKQLTEAKKEFNWLKKVHSQTLQASLERLELAYKKFFKEFKEGKISKLKQDYINKCLKNNTDINYHKLYNIGKPKWAKKDKYQTLVFKQNVKITEKGFKLPGFGEVKVFNKKYEFNGQIKQAKLTKKVDGLYLSIVVETENIIRENQSDSIVSLDMGVSRFLTSSDGEIIDNPKHLFNYQKKLRVEQRKLSRKDKKSKNFKRQAKVVAKLHKKVYDTRLDFLHKVSTKFANDYSKIIVEDLNITKMVKNTNLAKHILDCSWGKFFELLETKTEVIKINPAYSSQECSKCGHTCKENRPTQSIFSCVKCKHTANADDDACLVLLKRYMEGASSFKVNVGQ
jgi:putative transposase